MSPNALCVKTWRNACCDAIMRLHVVSLIACQLCKDVVSNRHIAVKWVIKALQGLPTMAQLHVSISICMFVFLSRDHAITPVQETKFLENL